MSGIQPALAAKPKLPRYRFGNFELDTNSGELRRNGIKLRLQEQPYLVLRTLLESAGSIVAREDLHTALWPADTFVDFDTSLNTAIKRLREALGDSADVPVFIETVPRRGYRFLAPVQVTRNGTFSPMLQAAADHAVFSVPIRHLRWWLIAAGGVLLATVVVAVMVAYFGTMAMPRVIDSTQITFDGIGKGELHVRGGQIYFNERLANRVALMKVPATGGIPVALASTYPGLYLGDVSADNSKLLVGAPGNLWKGPFHMKIMDLSSGSLQNLGGMEAHDGSWAPGGKLILAKGNDVFLTNADGSGERKLLTAPGPAYYLRYSLDGRRLRFRRSATEQAEYGRWRSSAACSIGRQRQWNSPRFHLTFIWAGSAKMGGSCTSPRRSHARSWCGTIPFPGSLFRFFPGFRPVGWKLPAMDVFSCTSVIRKRRCGALTRMARRQGS